MALKNGQDYREDLRGLKPSVYIRGEKLTDVWEDRRLQSTLNLVGMHHDISFEPEMQALAVVHESLVDEPVRRFQHRIQRSMEDSILKVRLTREVTQQRLCGWCLSNMLCLMWATTYETDAKYGTSYHQRFQEYARYLMKNDYDCFWGMMDPKGDRSLRLSQQENLVGLKVVRRNAKGITVRGAKVSTSYACCSREIAVAPCKALVEEEKDFAVSFAIPVDTEGLHFIVREAPHRDNPQGDMECPVGSAIGIAEGTTIFEDVFVPWERVFMCGEWDMAERFPYFFGNLQRQSKCSCLAGHTDLLIGIAALVAEVNGLPMKGHIRDKITRMMIQAETAHGCALGAAAEGEVHPSGIFIPSTTIVNAGLNTIKNVAGEQIQLLHDIGGGILVTMPTEDDYRNPEIKRWMNEFLSGKEGYSTEERLRVLYLAQELAGSKLTGNFLGWAVNASGSPITGEILTREHYDLEKRVGIAKRWAGLS